MGNPVEHPNDDGASDELLGPRGKAVRPVSSLVLGGALMAFCALVAASTLMGGRDWKVVSLCALVAVLVWLFVSRPALRIDRDGVLLRNPMRSTWLSWPAIEEIRTRWVLELVAGGRVYPAWAVPSDPGRPRHATDLFRLRTHGSAQHDAEAEASRAAKKVIAQNIAAQLERLREANRRTRAGQVPVLVRRVWDPSSVLLLAAAVLAVTAAFTLT